MSHSSHITTERLVASLSANQNDDVLLCASLLQRSDQHFRAVSLLNRYPEAASSSRGKIVLAQSHAALEDWDSVKVIAARFIRLIVGHLLLFRPFWIVLVMQEPSVFYSQVSSTHCSAA